MNPKSNSHTHSKVTKCIQGSEYYRSQLKSHADGEQGFLTSLIVRTHLKRCAACLEELCWIQTSMSHLIALENSNPPANLRSRILSEIAMERSPVVPRPFMLRPAFTAVGSLVIIGITLAMYALPGMIHDRGRGSSRIQKNVNIARHIDYPRNSERSRVHSNQQPIISESPENYSDPTSREAQRLFLARQAADRQNTERDLRMNKAEALLALNMKSLLDPKLTPNRPVPIQLQVASISIAMSDLRTIAAKYGGVIHNVPSIEMHPSSSQATVNQPNVPISSSGSRPSERILVAMSIPSDKIEIALASISRLDVIRQSPTSEHLFVNSSLRKNSDQILQLTSQEKIRPGQRSANHNVEIAAGSHLILIELRT